MRKRYLHLLIAVILAMVFVPSLYAQRIVAEVSVQVSNLPEENQNKLRGLDRIIQSYINQSSWDSPDNYNYDFPFIFDIYFEEFIPVGFEDRYKARISVSNGSDMVYADRRWEFPLQPGVQLNYSNTFDPFRSMIDFYVLAAMGFEFDKIKKFGGTQYFEQARLLADGASLSSRFFLGWDRRTEWIEDYLRPENEHFRYLKFLYYTGEWLYYEERDKEMAKKYLLYATKQFERVQPEQLERFFELNYYNFAMALSDEKEFEALARVASADNEHGDFYERLLNRR